jgi:hypothetical protein
MLSYDFPCLNLKRHLSNMPVDAPVIRALEEIGNIPAVYPPELLEQRRAAFIAQLENERLGTLERTQPG